MVSFQHYGLYFSTAQVENARKQAKHKSLAPAWDQLRGEALSADASHDIRLTTLVHALRYRLDNQPAAGVSAVASLIQLTSEASMTGDRASGIIDSIIPLLLEAQSFELLRDQAAFSRDQHQPWLTGFHERGEPLWQMNPDQLSSVEHIWQMLLQLVAGIVLEDETLLNPAASFYRRTVDTDIHPEGYLPRAVQSPEPENTGGLSLRRQMLAVKGLVLMAEAARHVGLDLWTYASRGVSVVTAGLYPLYYYFYPEKWQWEPDLTTETAVNLFREHGSYLELLNRHMGQSTRAIDLILKDLRPIFDYPGGGPVTLTHALPIRRGLFG